MTAEKPIARGTVSTDGRYWWDGRAWVPFVSEDPTPVEDQAGSAAAAAVGTGILVVLLAAVMLGLFMVVLSFLT